MNGEEWGGEDLRKIQGKIKQIAAAWENWRTE